jgi:hypothetical protein
MSAPIADEIAPDPKKLADLKREYRELDDEVEHEIRMLREGRKSKESIFDELIARIAAYLGSAPNRRQGR